MGDYRRDEICEIVIVWVTNIGFLALIVYWVYCLITGQW